MYVWLQHLTNVRRLLVIPYAIPFTEKLMKVNRWQTPDTSSSIMLDLFFVLSLGKTWNVDKNRLLNFDFWLVDTSSPYENKFFAKNVSVLWLLFSRYQFPYKNTMFIKNVCVIVRTHSLVRVLYSARDNSKTEREIIMKFFKANVIMLTLLAFKLIDFGNDRWRFLFCFSIFEGFGMISSKSLSS